MKKIQERVQKALRSSPINDNKDAIEQYKRLRGNNVPKPKYKLPLMSQFSSQDHMSSFL